MIPGDSGDGPWNSIDNKDVSKVEITLNNGEILETRDFYDVLFLITWVSASEDDNYGQYIQNTKAYDSNNNVIFDDALHWLIGH